VATDGLKGARVLVTGGTGSIGTALVRELLRIGSREIRVLARRERTTHDGVRFLAADIGDGSALAYAVDGVDIVFHLAALKDVAACEADPDAALQTNVVGSMNLLMAVRNVPGVHRLIAISSDKACAPSGVLGMTKSTMEGVVTRFAKESGRSFGSVRFGNVWGASGSVLKRWEESAARDGHIDVTDPEMTRFVLTLPEAVGHLVALASRPFTGEVVAPRMRAYRLGDLAEVFAEENGVAVRIVGPRAGEKVHEDLVSKDEAPNSVAEGGLLVIGGGPGGPGIGTFTSADADRLSESELRELVRSP